MTHVGKGIGRQGRTKTCFRIYKVRQLLKRGKAVESTHVLAPQTKPGDSARPGLSNSQPSLLSLAWLDIQHLNAKVQSFSGQRMIEIQNHGFFFDLMDAKIEVFALLPADLNAGPDF